jgi:hypothetical protein
MDAVMDKTGFGLRKAGFIAFTAAAALVFAGCSGSADPDGAAARPTVTETATPLAAVEKSAPPAPTATIWPLTGLPGEATERPAVAVKIENSPEARPQTGLEDADLVWEEIVEGGISRYIAVWNSMLPAEIGPIRSIRPMDGNIVAPLHGLMVCSGGKAPFIATARDVGLQVLSMDGGNAGFYRVKTRPAPHNVYADPADFLAQADEEHSAPPVPQFTYAATAGTASAGVAGKATGKITLDMSGAAHPNWEWDAAAGTWLRSEGERPAESASGARLSATNVVAMKVAVRTAQGRDPAGNSIPESIVIGSGTGFVATDGKILHVTWSKESADQVPALTDDAGSPVTLAPGKTWVELVPESGSWTAAEPAGATPSAPAPSTGGSGSPSAGRSAGPATFSPSVSPAPSRSATP